MQDNFTVRDLRNILEASRMAAYRWDIGTGHILWSPGSAERLGFQSEEEIATSAGYASFFDLSSGATPYSYPFSEHGFVANPESGVRYEYVYALCPKGQESTERTWVEDIGCWFSSPDGHPTYAHGLVRSINERYHREQESAHLSRLDELTKQLNRWAFYAILEETIRRGKEDGLESFLLIFALNDLKTINELYGFDIADEYLRDAGMRLRSCLRSDDAVGRHCGNKFSVLLRGCGASDSELVVERLIASLHRGSDRLGGMPVCRSISAGGILIPTHADTARSAILYAQYAHTEARDQRVDYVVYQASEKRISKQQKNSKMTKTIASALNDGRVFFVLQPIVSAHDECPSFYEALVRIRKEDGGFLGTGAFLGNCEELGLIHLLDHRMLELVLSYLTQDPHIELSVNFSPDTVKNVAWFETLRAQAMNNPRIAKRLTLEITETTIFRDYSQIVDRTHALRELGYKIAIDDFGAGFTSFRNLQLLSIDMIKIDGRFVKNLSQEPDNQVFVRTLINLARALGIKSVAEWVEVRQDADLLKTWGIDYLQGHLFGKASVSDLPARRMDYLASSYTEDRSSSEEEKQERHQAGSQ